MRVSSAADTQQTSAIPNDISRRRGASYKQSGCSAAWIKNESCERLSLGNMRCPKRDQNMVSVDVEGASSNHHHSVTLRFDKPGLNKLDHVDDLNRGAVSDDDDGASALYSMPDKSTENTNHNYICVDPRSDLPSRSRFNMESGYSNSDSDSDNNQDVSELYSLPNKHKSGESHDYFSLDSRVNETSTKGSLTLNIHSKIDKTKVSALYSLPNHSKKTRYPDYVTLDPTSSPASSQCSSSTDE